MGQRIDEIGNRYGRLVVIGDAPAAGCRRRAVMRCDCGTEKVIALEKVRYGNTRSCGCLARERSARNGRAHFFKHGLTGSPTWFSWQAMLARCLRPTHHAYARYGGRGIAVCDAWQGEHGFETFLADLGERPDGTTLDRRNNDGDYEPGNCRWASLRAQAQNRGNSRALLDLQDLLESLPDLVALPEDVERARERLGAYLAERQLNSLGPSLRVASPVTTGRGE